MSAESSALAKRIMQEVRHANSEIQDYGRRGRYEDAWKRELDLIEEIERLCERALVEHSQRYYAKQEESYREAVARTQPETPYEANLSKPYIQVVEEYDLREAHREAARAVQALTSKASISLVEESQSDVGQSVPPIPVAACHCWWNPSCNTDGVCQSCNLPRVGKGGTATLHPAASSNLNDRGIITDMIPGRIAR